MRTKKHMSRLFYYCALKYIIANSSDDDSGNVSEPEEEQYAGMGKLKKIISVNF